MRRFVAQLKHRDRQQAGFTVIETIIVLAIAGIILFIVLLAIPALQRSSRNNQRKQDVQAILGAVSHWELNHSGNIPGSGDLDAALQASKAKLTFYDTSSNEVKIIGQASGATPLPNPVTSVDKVYVYNYQKCAADSSGKSTPAGAGYSDVVALYAIESGRDSVTSKCQQI